MTTSTPRGGAREKNGHWYANVRYGKGRRFEIRVPWATNHADAAGRAEAIASVAEKLTTMGRRDLVKRSAQQVAEASTPARLARVMKALDAIFRGAVVAMSNDVTFEVFAERYTSGELARMYPDYVKARKHDDDVSRLREYILPHVRDIPIVSFEFEHAQLVLSKLPKMSEANRRHVAQIMGRLMHLAVFPCRLLKASPLPRGWLPKITKRKQFFCLYPKEEAQLLGCADVPEVWRLFCGVLDREGMRLSMLLNSEWRQWGTDVGMFTPGKTKTGDGHPWATKPDVTRAMKIWRERQAARGLGGPHDKPFVDIVGKAGLMPDRKKLAGYYRASLRAAGLTRLELFESSATTGKLRAHDMRATFVTVSIAEGRSETWIRDRTAHRSTLMIDRYRRMARAYTELDLGGLADLGEALGWWKPGGKARADEGSDGGSTSEKDREQSMERTMPAEAEPKFAQASPTKPKSTVFPGDLHASKRRETSFHQPSTTPDATFHTSDGGSGGDPEHLARPGALGGPGTARAFARAGGEELPSGLASAQRGVAALAVGWDVLEHAADRLVQDLAANYDDAPAPPAAPIKRKRKGGAS